VPGGIAHAFNGSDAQAAQFVERGFRLGFGGAMTFERALQIRQLAATLPDTALVLETDAPDIPPQWLYRTASGTRARRRATSRPSCRASPARWPNCAAGRSTTRHGAPRPTYAACRREGSLDSAIEAAEANDIAALAWRLPRLAAIAHNGGESARSMRLTAALGLPVLRLPSTSPAHASWSFDRKLDAWREAFRVAGIA
jgi:hypothetical protein